VLAGLCSLDTHVGQEHRVPELRQHLRDARAHLSRAHHGDDGVIRKLHPTSFAHVVGAVEPWRASIALAPNKRLSMALRDADFAVSSGHFLRGARVGVDWLRVFAP